MFNFNKKRLNRGCKIFYHQTEQRRKYFDFVYYLSDFYRFKSLQIPKVYEEFSLPGKGFQGSGYFQRLKAILLYKPQVVSPDGKIDLFLKMEKTKLAYILLKSNFKLSFME